jgi:hypothetical protein
MKPSEMNLTAFLNSEPSHKHQLAYVTENVNVGIFKI